MWEGIVATMEYVRGENREVRGEIRRQEKIVNRGGFGRIQPLKEEGKECSTFFFCSHLDDPTISSPWTFLIREGSCKKQGTNKKEPNWKKTKHFLRYLITLQELVPFSDSKCEGIEWKTALSTKINSVLTNISVRTSAAQSCHLPSSNC